MSVEERIAALEQENIRLKEDNEKLMSIIAQMKVTLNRLVKHYISEGSKHVPRLKKWPLRGTQKPFPFFANQVCSLL